MWVCLRSFLSLLLIFTFILPLQTAIPIAWASENVRVRAKDEDPKTCTYCHRDFDEAQGDISQCDTCGVGAHEKCAEALSFQCGNLGCGGAFADSTSTEEKLEREEALAEVKRIQDSIPPELGLKEATIMMSGLGAKFRSLLFKGLDKNTPVNQREKIIKSLDRLLLTARIILDRFDGTVADASSKASLSQLPPPFLKEMKKSQFFGVASYGSGFMAALLIAYAFSKSSGYTFSAVILGFFAFLSFLSFGDKAREYAKQEKEKKPEPPKVVLNPTEQKLLQAFFAPLTSISHHFGCEAAHEIKDAQCKIRPFDLMHAQELIADLILQISPGNSSGQVSKTSTPELP